MGLAIIGSVLLHILGFWQSRAMAELHPPAQAHTMWIELSAAEEPPPPAPPPPAPPPAPDPAPASAPPAPAAKAKEPPPQPQEPAAAVPVLTAPDDGQKGGAPIASGQGKELLSGAVSAASTSTVAASAPPPPAPAAAPPQPERLALARSYLAKVRASLRRMQRYPEAAQRLGLTGAATLALTIDRAGRFIEVAVVQSSGHTILDQAAQTAVRGLSGRIPRPDDLGDTPLRTTVRLIFDLED